MKLAKEGTPTIPTTSRPRTTPNAPMRATDPIPGGNSLDNTPLTIRPLPVTCGGHLDRDGCPTHLRGRLGPWESSERKAKIAALQEINRCFICRGTLPGSPTPQSSPETSQSPTPGPRGPPRMRGAQRGRGGRATAPNRAVHFEDSPEDDESLNE